MFGMPSLLELDSLEDQFKTCSDLGLDFVELNLNMQNLMDVEAIINLKKVYHLQVSVHANESLDPFNLDDILRQGHLKLFHSTMTFADAISAIGVTMHLPVGIHFTLPDKKVYLNKKYKVLYQGYVDHFRKQMSYKTPLNIENTGVLNHAFLVETLKRLLEHKNINLTYDVGHDCKSGYIDRAFYQEHCDHIKHLHLHDVKNKKDHLELFTGQLDLDKLLKTYTVPTVIEVKTKTHLMQSIDALKERGYL